MALSPTTSASVPIPPGCAYVSIYYGIIQSTQASYTTTVTLANSAALFTVVAYQLGGVVGVPTYVTGTCTSSCTSTLSTSSTAVAARSLISRSA